MKNIIKNPFRIFQKDISIIFCIASVLVFLSGCSKSNSPQKVILGEWELIADGPNEDDMHQRTGGSIYKFFPDGTLIVYLETHSEIHGDNSRKFTYTIDSNLLARRYYYDDGSYSEECYRYHLFKNQLRLIREPMYPVNQDGNSMHLEIYITNIIIFQRIK